MLTINTRNDKLAAARIDFLSRGMLNGTCLSETLRALSGDSDNIDDEGTTSNSDGDSLDLDADDDENDNGEDSPCGPVDGPPIFGEVTLALRKGAPHTHVIIFTLTS